MKITKCVQLQQSDRTWHWMRKRAALAAVLLAAVATTALAANGPVRGRGDEREEERERGVYAIGLWGDFPYSDVQATVGVPNLIADMNANDLEFTVHDGDLKAGNSTPGSATPTTCADALYLQGLAYFNALKAPAVFTPGDNDWTDCDRTAGCRPAPQAERQLGSHPTA